MMLGAGSPDSVFDTITLRDDHLTASSRNAASERATHGAVASERLAGLNRARYPILPCFLVQRSSLSY